LRKKQLAHEVAKNGEEAVERWRAGDFGLILVRVVTFTLLAARSNPCCYQMDIDMPIMDGIQATKEIRRLEEGTPAPPATIIALIAGNQPEGRAIIAEAGCDDVLIKPISLKLLADKIREWGLVIATRE
jgi:osomolarity two-component system response regulator SSK1